MPPLTPVTPQTIPWLPVSPASDGTDGQVLVKDSSQPSHTRWTDEIPFSLSDAYSGKQFLTIAAPAADENNDFHLIAWRGANPFGTRSNNVLRLGYNLSESGLSQDETTDVGAGWTIESNYQPDATQQNIEMYTEIYKVGSPAVYMRPWGAYYNRVNDKLAIYNQADWYLWLDQLQSNIATPWMELGYLAGATSEFHVDVDEIELTGLIALYGYTAVVTDSASGILVLRNAQDTQYQLGICGATKGMRFTTDAGGSSIMGVDDTLSGSYEPLTLDGSTLTLCNSGTAKLSIAGGVTTFADASLVMTNLPSANPGAGTKRLWYDATDSNRVKFAA